MDISEQNAVEELPFEILTYILLRLSTAERKNARLVNSLWYEVSKETVILKRQKIIFDNVIYKNQLNLMFDVLNSAHYLYYNLEFRNQNFYLDLNIFCNFIKSNSDYVYSLCFINCSFPFIMLEEIIINCSNLKELHFNNCTCIGFKEATLIPNLNQKLVQKNLTVLEIIKCHWMTNYVFNIFVSVYPNIKKINLSLMKIKYLTHPEEIVDEQNLHVSQFSFYNFYRKSGLNLANLESLTLNDPVWDYTENDVDEERLSEFISIPELKLKELNLRGHSYYEKINFPIWFSKQKNLKSVDLRYCGCTLPNIEILFQQCPNLEILQFSLDFRGNQAPVKQILELMAKSKLKYLNIENIISLVEGKTFSDFPLNYNAYKLGLHGRWIGNTLAITLLEFFCNLTHLDLSDTCIKGCLQEVREFIFQKQVNLKTLKLNNCSWITDDAFQNCKLANLECLELAKCQLTEASFSEFNFSKLILLSLENCDKVADEGFAQIPSKCPLLRYLNLNDTSVERQTVINICENLKFLHYLRIKKSSKPLDVYTGIILEHCPSIRTVQMRENDVYVYNCFQKELILYDKSQPRCNCCHSKNDNLRY